MDPRDLAIDKDFSVTISCKLAPLPGQEGTVVYETYNDIVADIISNAD